MQQAILQMRNISKSFAGVQALKHVDFELRKGEVHALMGENGAGKSTLMKVLIGVYAADEGTIYYKDQEIAFHSVLEAQNNGISMIFQELNLVPHLSVAENIFLAREPLKNGLVNFSLMREKAAALLEMFDIDVSPDDIINTLSVAKQQMVEIAKALSFDVEVLIMDEPTSALTKKEIDRLFLLIDKLKKRDVCIVYISHRMEELKRICDHITIFRDGCYISDHVFRDITMDAIITQMVGRTLDNHFPARKSQVKDHVILSIQNATRYGVFQGIDFDLLEGEILGITGLVGAKRTELARAVFGAETLDEGQIVSFDREITITSPHDAILAGIAYLSEDRKLNGLAVNMSIKSNVMMAALEKVCGKCGIISSMKEKLACDQYIRKLNIKTPHIEQIVKNLSGGNQQKVVIAKWLFREAKIMIFDEPTRGIDVGAKYAIYELLDELASQGIGVIMISSELPEILGMTDRVVVMREGEMTAVLPTRQTDQEEIMQYATGVKNMYRTEQEWA
ncbi:sugar ABC transporter ATP-binding protein [Martelella alba]|uniref:Sugar ABC transporter ATP-binding protein n=1 Tax=Martelella alba TaxID=2590451 RepID=A0ABY2SGP3_9HYPH|nr:sugar ABC transporter ATP-binding protein [Martelella alba]TKI04088.1 sugar ABC transporter ATP-binding protein [Martelella alba]